VTKPRSSSAQLQRGARLGIAIQRARKRRGVSQSELARSAGISVESIRKLEQGHTPSPGVFSVVDIAAALDIQVTALVGRGHGKH
jgi:transcriptional regulator with XRE-family HTH domain